MWHWMIIGAEMYAGVVLVWVAIAAVVGVIGLLIGLAGGKHL